jgi:hypothetical protein
MEILNSLRRFGIFYGDLGYAVVIWYIFPFWYVVPRDISHGSHGSGRLRLQVTECHFVAESYSASLEFL